MEVLKAILAIIQAILKPKTKTPALGSSSSDLVKERNKIANPTVRKNQIVEAIDWSNPDSKISKYFTVKEAIWLNKWGKLADPDFKTKAAILKLAAQLDVVREFLGVPMIVTSWYRPMEYNVAIGGAKMSQHRLGLAVDFVPRGLGCEEARQKLLPMLEAWKMRMEDNAHINGGNWVHLDLGPVVSRRFFKP